MLEKRIFYRGAAVDVSLTGVGNGFYKWSENCLVQSGIGLTNLKGNLAAEFEDGFTFYEDNPTFYYNCLGSFYDSIKSKVYFFVWCQDDATSANQYSFIFEYDLLTGIVNVVCDEDWSDYLLFEEDELITGISVVFIDVDKPLLYWTQRAGLRKINVYKAKQYYAGTGGYIAPSLEIIDRIKYPPVYAPEIKQITDTAFSGNNIDRRFFQFSVSNVYDDYERSVPSEWSRVNIPYFPYAPVSNDVPLFEQSQRNNLIKITLKKPFETVEKLQILVREKTSNVGVEINYDWRIYDVLTVADIAWDGNDEYVYYFYNDKIGQIVTQEFANRVFDNVPRKADADTFAEDSRMYQGGITEGFDLETVNADIVFTESNFTDVSDAEFIDLYVYQNVDGFNRGTLDLPTSPTGMEVGGTIEFQFTSTDVVAGDYNFQYIIKEGDLDNYPTDLILAMNLAFNSYIGSVLGAYFTMIFGGSVMYIENGYNPSGTDQNQIISAWYKDLKNCLPQFKNRHNHYFGLGYGDEGGRRSSVQKLDKYYHSSALEKVLTGRIEINHVPPIWATHYYVYYAGFDAGNLYQTKVTNISDIDANGNYICTVNFFQTSYKYSNITYLKYEYSAGDRIKFLYGMDTGELSAFIDLAVVKGNTDGTILVEASQLLIDALDANTEFIVEIYKKSLETDLYFTISKNAIGDAGTVDRYHKGNIQDQDLLPSAIPCVQEFEGVNMYIRPRYINFNAFTNIYTFYNAPTLWYDQAPPDPVTINVSFYFYKDSAMTQLLVGCNFNSTFTTGFGGTFVAEMGVVADTLNEVSATTANWFVNDPAYSIYFFSTNFNCAYNASPSQFVITQLTNSSEPQIYMKIESTSNNTTDIMSDTAQFSSSQSGTIETLYIEDPNQSDIFVGKETGDGGSINGSAVTSFGKPNIVNDNFREVKRESTIYHSEQFIPESNINGLSSYPDGSFRDYQYWGSIQKLSCSDRNLKVFMESRVGYIPVKQYLTGGDGANVVLNNAQILTEMVYYQEKRGIGLHPESHAYFGGADYFVSQETGSICRISRDGLTVISDVKDDNGNYLVRQYLYNLITGNQNNFVACFNPRRNTYEVNIGGCVITWDEKLNNFIGGRSYNGEMFGSGGNDMVSFNNGVLYLHEANPVYNNFYDRQYSSYVTVVGNSELKNKIYKSLRTKSTTAWAAPQITNDRGQFSLLMEDNFSEREGIFYAEFKRDMNTPNVVYPIINGVVLRDFAIQIKLENYNLQKEILTYVEINQIDSK
ncbi:MAG: hypothetical protein IPN99_13995 [Bacteroidetes bacterium]|nr:hypothetical protein [Bacteroidota bacterium]